MFRKFLIFCIISSAIAVAAEDRSKELGIIDYFAKYEHHDQRRHKIYDKMIKKLFADIAKLGVKPEWADVDIFLSGKAKERNQYKRIMIPYWGDWFTKEMYEGMLDYVKSGGLLITQSGLSLEDKNSDYQCGDIGVIKLARNSFLGVRGSGGARKTEIKAIMVNPLTKDLKQNTWLDIGKKVYGRANRNISANVAVIAKQEFRKKVVEGPFLTWKQAGKGACIYFSCVYWPDNPPINQLMKNVLSEETLKWLCPREK